VVAAAAAAGEGAASTPRNTLPYTSSYYGHMSYQIMFHKTYRPSSGKGTGRGRGRGRGKRGRWRYVMKVSSTVLGRANVYK